MFKKKDSGTSIQTSLNLCYRFEYPPDLHQYSGYYDDQYGYYGDYHGQRWDPHVQAWVQQTAGNDIWCSGLDRHLFMNFPLILGKQVFTRD